MLDVFLRINGHALKDGLTSDLRLPGSRFLNNGSFDMEQLAPWLQAIIVDVYKPEGPAHAR